MILTRKNQSTHRQNLFQCNFVYNKSQMGWQAILLRALFWKCVSESQCGKPLNWKNKNASASITGLTARVYRVIIFHIQSSNLNCPQTHRRQTHKSIPLHLAQALTLQSYSIFTLLPSQCLVILFTRMLPVTTNSNTDYAVSSGNEQHTATMFWV